MAQKSTQLSPSLTPTLRIIFHTVNHLSLYHPYIVAVIVLVVGELDDAVRALPDVALHLVLIQLHVLARPLLRDGVDALRLLQGFPPNLKYIFPQINSITAKVDLLC